MSLNFDTDIGRSCQEEKGPLAGDMRGGGGGESYVKL